MKRHGHWLASLTLVAALGCSGNTDIAGPSESGDRAMDSHTRYAPPPCRGNRPLAVACEQLATTLQFPNTVFTSATSVSAGALAYAGQSIPAHCLVTGRMYDRIGADVCRSIGTSATSIRATADSMELSFRRSVPAAAAAP
jgi:hypothetical protein